jgi:hypothetical protein
MSAETHATRRSFIAVAGAALSAPVAAAAATSSAWLPPSDGNGDPLAAQLTVLQDLNEIRGLNQAYLQHAAAGARGEMAALFADPRNAAIDGALCISPDGFGEQDAIEVADDRQTATARLHVTVHTETRLDADCTLVQMAQTQGEGVVRASESAVIENSCIKRGGAWKILRSVRRPAGADAVSRS